MRKIISNTIQTDKPIGGNCYEKDISNRLDVCLSHCIS